MSRCCSYFFTALRPLDSGVDMHGGLDVGPVEVGDGPVLFARLVLAGSNEVQLGAQLGGSV